MSWDVALGLLLVMCGLVLAIWDRSRYDPQAPRGNAVLRGAKGP